MGYQTFSDLGLSKRQLRVAREVHKVLSGLLRDYALFGENRSIQVNVTEVRMSPDLRHAKIYLTSFSAKPALLLEDLAKEKNNIRNMMQGKLSFKFLPDLAFYFDNSLENAQRIESLLAQNTEPLYQEE